MADKIKINVHPFVGEYDFDIEAVSLSTLEWRWIKQISGYMPLTIDKGWQGGDPDLFVAFAVVALARAGKVEKQQAMEVADALSEAPFDGAAISYIGAVDADPPVEKAPDASASPDASTSNGGALSSRSSGRSESDQSPTGHHDSPRSVTSGLETLRTSR